MSTLCTVFATFRRARNHVGAEKHVGEYLMRLRVRSAVEFIVAKQSIKSARTVCRSAASGELACSRSSRPFDLSL